MNRMEVVLYLSMRARSRRGQQQEARQFVKCISPRSALSHLLGRPSSYAPSPCRGFPINPVHFFFPDMLPEEHFRIGETVVGATPDLSRNRLLTCYSSKQRPIPRSV